MNMKPLLSVACAAVAVAIEPLSAQVPAIRTTSPPAAAAAEAAAVSPNDSTKPAFDEASPAAVVLPQHKYRPLSPAALQVIAANRAATQEPSGAGFINASQVYAYGDGSLYHLYTAPGQVTDIALQPGEVLGAVAAGDTVRWIIGDTSSGSGETKRSHVLVKPFASGQVTNLIITTDRHVYHLSLTSTVRTAMAMVSWAYPQDELIALKKAADAAVEAAPVAQGLQIDQLHFYYLVSGDRPDWRPLRAFDDGRQTFIEFPPDIATGVAPPLFVVGPKNEAELVNYRVRGRFYVVDRLFDAAELRFGLKHQDIVRITRVGDAGHRRAS